MLLSLLPQFFFISILSTIICITNFTHAYSHCMEDQKILLLELKHELIFSSSYSRKLVQWNHTDDCCIWEGVECDGAGHVISLQLDDEAILGGLENSSGLFNLRYLEKLNLAYNDFNFIKIPRGIGNLTYLTHLNLSYAAFGGQVPIELSLLRRLVSLAISGNWDLPLKLEIPNLKMLIQNLTGLRELYLDGVDISAQNSEWYDIISSSLPHLRNLSLRYCSLSSPSDRFLSQFHFLTILRLDGNDLSTVLPDFFANFSSLTVLSLSNCSLISNNFFTGSHSSTLFRGLSNLVYLDLWYNSLSGNIPPSFFGLPSLQTLDLSNNQFSGQLNEIPTINLSNMRHLNLWYNSLSGQIPPSFFGLPSLQTLILSDNQFSGQVSEFPTQNLNLVYLDLGYNSLSGSIPQSFFGLPSLQTLYLSKNQFSQLNEISTLNLSNLRNLRLYSNRLEGPIPESFFQLKSLEALVLTGNSFNGTFQLEKIQKLRNLRYLDLSYNNLSVDASCSNSSLSAFPQLRDLGLASCNLNRFPDLRNQSNLISLDLSKNQIAGEIPSWIWEIGDGELYFLNLSCNLLVDLQKPYKIPSSLDVLDLHSNQLRGELPLPILPNIGGFTSNLFFFSVANNSFTGSIATSFCSFINFEVLDLSFNNLSGIIPPCLLESNYHLQVLKLRRNSISGDIPNKFSVNCSLQSLDLSNNYLRGNIPKSLENCKSLAVMNVGNNEIDDSFPCMLSSSLRVLVLRANKFHGEVRCNKSWPNLQIIDIAYNNFSGYLYPVSFSSWKGMMQESDALLRANHSGFHFLRPNGYYQDEVTLTMKGLEVKLVKIWPDFTSIDFSSNNFQGQIPDSMGDLISLHLLNLSHNDFTSTIPQSFGNLSQLDSLDLSVNRLTGTIPMELAGLTFLSLLNLSYNKLVGKIPIGPQIQTFSEDSFKGNIGLCGPPLNISCSNTDQNDLSPPRLENVQSHGKMEIEWEYVFAALGYVVGLGSIVWILLCCQSFRQKYFDKVDEILEQIFDRHDREKRHRRRRVHRNQVRRQYR